MDLVNSEFTEEIDNAFHDLSARSTIFRTKLIEEFQLLDNLAWSGGATYPPQYNSRDIKDTATLQKILADNPYELIKFQAFKRTKDTQKVDRRLTRIKNANSVPLGAWAGWVVKSRTFQTMILLLILVNAVLVGIAADYHDHMANDPLLLEIINLIDIISLLIFYIDIGLRWADNFSNFWSDGWNVFDFLITIGTTIPQIINLITGSNTSFSKVVSDIRTFRILQTLKAAVWFGNLRIIIITILEAFRSMAFIMALLLMVTYIFAIIGIYGFESYSAVEGHDFRFSDSFADLAMALQTLFQFLTLDNWREIHEEMVQAADPVFTTVYVVMWVWIGAFIFRNIFVGVMVNNFSRISEVLKEKRQVYIKNKKFERMRRRLRKELLVVKSTIQKSMDDLSHAVDTEKTTESKTALNELSAEENSIKDFRRMYQSKERNGQVDESDDLLNNIQKILSSSQGEQKGWELTVERTLAALTVKSEETLWPRDTLFEYFQLMESLQENMREYQELQTLANLMLLDMNDT